MQTVNNRDPNLATHIPNWFISLSISYSLFGLFSKILVAFCQILRKIFQMLHTIPNVGFFLIALGVIVDLAFIFIENI